MSQSEEKPVYKYDKGDYPKMEDMLSIDWDKEFSKHEENVQAKWDIFTMKIREALERDVRMNKEIPSTTKCKNTS